MTLRIENLYLPSPIVTDSSHLQFNIDRYTTRDFLPEQRSDFAAALLGNLGREFMRFDKRDKVAMIGYQLWNSQNPDEKIRAQTDFDFVIDNEGRIQNIVMIYNGPHYSRAHYSGSKEMNKEHLRYRAETQKGARGLLATAVSASQFTIEELKDFFNTELELKFHKDKDTGIDYVVLTRMALDAKSFYEAKKRLHLKNLPENIIGGFNNEPVLLDRTYGDKIFELLNEESQFHSFSSDLMNEGGAVHWGYFNKDRKLVSTGGRRTPVDTPFGYHIVPITDLATRREWKGKGLAMRLRIHDLNMLFEQCPDALAIGDSTWTEKKENEVIGFEKLLGYHKIGEFLWVVGEPINQEEIGIA